MMRIWGSSPLTRGKQNIDRETTARPRLIPAHAGKTTAHEVKTAQKQAHPRSRGENRSYSHSASAALGSSPLTRGKHLAIEIGLAARGLIPAHAGKTLGRA